MKPRLLEKLSRIRVNPAGGDFILADAKDPDMAFGIASPGRPYPPVPGGEAPYRTLADLHEQIRRVVQQDAVDMMLTSVATMSLLQGRERLFDASDVTPAVRINDSTDIWCVRGGRYREQTSRPFASPYLDECKSVAELGLYSITLNNDLAADLETLTAFKDFHGGPAEWLSIFPGSLCAERRCGPFAGANAGLRERPHLPAVGGDSARRAAGVPQDALFWPAMDGGINVV